MNNDRSILKMSSVYLRPFTLDDVTETYQGWLNDPKVNQFLEVRHSSQTLDELKDYVQGTHDDPLIEFWAVVALDKNIVVGTVSLHQNKIHQTTYYGCLIGNEDYWGTSLPLEAQIAIVDHAFLDLSLRRVWGGVYGRNTAMHFNFKKMGFKREGTLRESLIGADGQVDDAHIFGILKDEWLQQRLKFSKYMPDNGIPNGR